MYPYFLFIYISFKIFQNHNYFILDELIELKILCLRTTFIYRKNQYYISIYYISH